MIKKKFLALVLIAAGAFAITANAQSVNTGCANGNTECQVTNKTCDNNKSKTRKGKKTDKDASAAQQRKAAAFKGIELTEAQQKAISELNAKRAEARKQARQTKTAKTAKADKTAATADKRDSRMEQRLAYLKDMQAILTPDQYVTFLENTAASAPKYQGNRQGRNNNVKEGRKGQRKGRDGRRSAATKATSGQSAPATATKTAN